MWNNIMVQALPLTLLIVLITTGSASAQLLTGVIKYPTGEPAPHAPIQAKNKATGAAARTFSGADGHYELAGLAAGSYDFSIAMPCCAYQRVNREITLEAGKPIELNVALIETINGSTLGDDPARNAEAMRKRAKVPSGPAPRTLDGKPDLSGVWLITDDPYPEPPEPLPSTAALINQLQAKDAPHNRCLPGPPPTPGSASPFIAKLVQTSSLIVILIEDNPGFRQIFLDGRSHPADWNPSWTGHSTGKWDQDTLVVDTVGFNNKNWLGGIGGGTIPTTEMLHMTERYRRVDFGHMELQVTFDDPGALAKPYRENLTLDLAPQEEILEYVCENNKPEHLVGK
jgi:Carboxypeptidase regulatory-like domain